MSTFNDYAQNTHRIEFEAPNSAEVQPDGGRKHFSIDLSLELERQLELESPPITPGHDLTSAIDTRQKHEALDPEVLAHLVMQLRHSLTEITKERDELAKLLAASHAQEASLNDALQLMTEKATETGEQLDEARKKMRDDEEAITLLRAKVEESRRGLMRLQTESRRHSMAPIDVNRASLLGSPPSKRASFTPMTGRANSHRRISSVSDLVPSSGDLQPSPNAQVLTFPDSGSSLGVNPPLSSARYPGLFGRHSPSRPESPDSDKVSLEMEDLRKELQRVKDELETTRHELLEVTESKEASETCVRALREFISGNIDGSGGSSALPLSSIKLPPPPTMTTGEEADTETRRPATSTWGFTKLWGGDSPRVPSSSTVPHTATVWSPQLSATPALPAVPMSRKLGGFFGSRSSVSSISSATLPPLQTNASNIQRNLSHQSTSSDTSSVLEPISPGSDIHGLGTAPVVVGDVTNMYDTGNSHGTPDTKSIHVEAMR